MTSELEDQLRKRLSPDFADGLACSRNLYAFAAGELSPAEADAFQRHARTCPECRLDLASYERSRHPAAPARAGHRGAWYWIGIVLAGATAAVTIALWQGETKHLNQPAGGPLSTPQIKGGPSLQIAVRRQGREFIASPGQTFTDGDTVGFFYSSSQPVWPAIFHCTEQGDVNRIYPVDKPELLPPASGAPLPAGATIEPAAGCEWIVAVFSPERSRPSYDRLLQVMRQALASQTPGCMLSPVASDLAIQVWPLLRSPSE